MKKFGAYFTAQLKRICRVLPFVAVILTMLAGCMLLLVVTLWQSDSESDRKQKVKIGLVGDTSVSYLGFGIMALQKLDESKLAIDFVDMSEERAKRELQKGQISAYVIIPYGFIEALERGEDVQLVYETTNDSAGVAALIMNEVVESISDILKESQNSINGTWHLMWKYGAPGDMVEVSDWLYLRFVATFLRRTEIYPILYTGIEDGLSFYSYYFVAFAIFFMLLWGIAGSCLFIRRDMALPKLLKARGQDIKGQVLAEYLAYFLLMTGVISLLLLPTGFALQKFGIEIQEWEDAPIEGVLLFGVQMIPVMALVAALQFFLYEVVSDIISGVMLQFLVGFGLGYLSGCVYPVTFFPESIQHLAPFLPTHAALRYGMGCLRSELAGKELGVMMLYLLLFLGLTVWVRERRVKA